MGRTLFAKPSARFAKTLVQSAAQQSSKTETAPATSPWGPAEVQAWWKAIYGKRLVKRDGSEGELRELLSSLKSLAYSGGGGHQYKVSPATVQDRDELCALSDEFVRMHGNMVNVESKSDDDSWCRYLGLHPDHAERRKAFSLSSSSSNRRPASSWESCTLKCELVGASTNGGSEASSSGSVVGYVHFKLEEPKEDQRRCSKRLKRKRGECTGEYTTVTHIVVAPEHRRRGLAKLMLLAVAGYVFEHHPAHLREIFLTVAVCNKAAVRLYESLGFQVIGENHTKADNAAASVAWLQMRIVRHAD